MSRKKRKIDPLKLYLQGHEEEIEIATDELRDQEAILRFNHLPKRSSVKKWHKLVVNADSLNVYVPIVSYEALVEGAVKNYNQIQDDKERRFLKSSGLIAHRHSSPDFLHRLIFNFIMHELTSYESDLRRLADLAKTRNVYIQIRMMYINEISRVYPFLTEECEKQLKKPLKLPKEEEHAISL